MEPGTLRHRVTLSTPGPLVADGEGGYTDTGVTLVSRAPAAVEPATPQALERIGATTVTATATHVVTLRYLQGVTTLTRLVFHDVIDRTFAVTGVYDGRERHQQLILTCAERVS